MPESGTIGAVFSRQQLSVRNTVYVQPRPAEPDYQLLWPRALFAQEAAKLLNSRNTKDWNQRCSMLLIDAFAGGQQAGPAADLREVTREQEQRSDPWDFESPRPSVVARGLSAEQTFLRSLISIADQLHEDPSPRAYWKERKFGTKTDDEPPRLTTAMLASKYVQLMNVLDDDLGYFDMRFDKDCVDDLRGNAPSQFMEDWLHESDLWPLSPERLGEDEDLLYSVIELLHDHVARPRGPGWYHDYCECGWHRTDFDVSAGRQVYRWRVNKLLARSDCGLRLADEGEDAGRLVAVTDAARTELVVEVAHRTADTTDDQVRHALALFRSRGADRHQKRSAIAALSLILEERRYNVLKDALPSKDRGDLFQIANGFNIRHQRDDQKTDYDDYYLDWVFWLFLATVELTNRILDEQRSLINP